MGVSYIKNVNTEEEKVDFEVVCGNCGKIHKELIDFDTVIVKKRTCECGCDIEFSANTLGNISCISKTIVEPSGFVVISDCDGIYEMLEHRDNIINVVGVENYKEMMKKVILGLKAKFGIEDKTFAINCYDEEDKSIIGYVFDLPSKKDTVEALDVDKYGVPYIEL